MMVWPFRPVPDGSEADTGGSQAVLDKRGRHRAAIGNFIPCPAPMHQKNQFFPVEIAHSGRTLARQCYSRMNAWPLPANYGSVQHKTSAISASMTASRAGPSPCFRTAIRPAANHPAQPVHRWQPGCRHARRAALSSGPAAHVSGIPRLPCGSPLRKRWPSAG